MNINHLCGWKRDDTEVARVMSANSRLTFKQAAPALDNFWQQEEVALWEATKKINNGNFLPADLQTIGDCVSHGHARAVDYCYCVAQSINKASGYVEGQTSCMSESLYGEAREVGNDLNYSDGAVGIWAIEALQKFGHNGRNGVPYDGQKAKQWGAKGTPQSFKDEGRQRILKDYAKLESPDDMANALKAGHPCTICTQLGFTMTRDSNGVCRRQGSWGHCMCVIGMFSVSSSWFFVILQSWGQNTPDGPVPYGGPDNSFGCDWSTMAHILGEGDSYALNAFEDWKPVAPKEELTWVM